MVVEEEEEGEVVVVVGVGAGVGVGRRWAAWMIFGGPNVRAVDDGI